MGLGFKLPSCFSKKKKILCCRAPIGQLCQKYRVKTRMAFLTLSSDFSVQVTLRTTPGALGRPTLKLTRVPVQQPLEAKGLNLFLHN